MSSFILAMAMHPDILKRGQAAVDAVIGHSRLPMLADEAVGIPYVTAIVKEVLRWKPIAPLGLMPVHLLPSYVLILL
jgi:cytochrome P450